MIGRKISILALTIWFVCVAVGNICGCASHKVVMPTMDLPPEPQKPAIKSSVIVQNQTAWVAYTIPDSLKLYEFLLRKDSYEEKLRYRIESMNKLMEAK